MLKQADFYILKQQDEQARRRFACRLAQKIYMSKLTLYIRTANEAESALLDELLWTFDDISFVPHAVGTQLTDGTPVVINHLPYQQATDVTMNLTDATLNDTKSERLCELVLGLPESTQLARKRYKDYQAQSLKLNTYKI